MTDALQTQTGGSLTNPAEDTRPGPVFVPAVDIFETDTQITVLADMPGIPAENLDIDVNDGILTLIGRAATAPSTDRRTITTEYRPGSYQRQFQLSGKIDQTKIEAKLTQGVLRLTLPKVEKAQARRITVQGE